MGLEIINVYKKKKGFTNEDLSALSGVPKGTIDKITAGTTKDPKLETLKAIAKVLGCSLNDFDEIKKSPVSAEAEAKELEPDEQCLINNYRELNDDGKTAAQDSVEALTCLSKYKKCDDSQELA